MNAEEKLVAATIAAILFAALTGLAVKVHHRERDHDEFNACLDAGGSILDRRSAPTCRMGGAAK